MNFISIYCILKSVSYTVYYSIQSYNLQNVLNNLTILEIHVCRIYLTYLSKISVELCIEFGC